MRCRGNWFVQQESEKEQVHHWGAINYSNVLQLLQKISSAPFLLEEDELVTYC